MEDLTFVVETGSRQCVNISLVSDTALEEDELFVINAVSNDSLVTVIQPDVLVTILNDDCKRCLFI